MKSVLFDAFRCSLLLALGVQLIACSDHNANIALGTLERDRIVLKATAAEIITQLPLAEGSDVKAGDLLLQLDDRRQQALVAKADAVLECWYPGQEGGQAVAEALLGDINPGAKLPVSVVRNAGQIPLFYNHKPSARRGYLFDVASGNFVNQSGADGGRKTRRAPDGAGRGGGLDRTDGRNLRADGLADPCAGSRDVPRTSRSAERGRGGCPVDRDDLGPRGIPRGSGCGPARRHALVRHDEL